MKILMSGGSGLLGQEIKKLDDTIIAPPRRFMDIGRRSEIRKAIFSFRPTHFLHLAAKTDPPTHDERPQDGIMTNIMGTCNVVLECMMMRIKVIYVSSDYVYAGSGPHREDDALKPPSKFIWSKLGGEAAVQMMNNSLIIRCSFGPRPFPHDQVYDDQLNSKLYVDEIAPMILEAAKSGLKGVVNIGSEGQSLWAYAKKTKPDIKTIPTPAWVPRDTTLDTSKWKSRTSA